MVSRGNYFVLIYKLFDYMYISDRTQNKVRITQDVTLF